MRTHHRTTPAGRQDRLEAVRAGGAALETALVLPLLLLFALAAIDFGRVVHTNLLVSNAARCGAEYGSMHGFTPYNQASWEANVRASIAEEMTNLQGFEPDLLQTDIVTSTDSDGLFRVALHASYPFRTFVTWPGIPSQLPVASRIVMRQAR